jgi:cell wall-associated NlpC family hydrolase
MRALIAATLGIALLLSSGAQASFTPSQATQVVNEANSSKWKNIPYAQMDCSHFVYNVYRKFAPNIPYLNTDAIQSSPLYQEVAIPSPGDLVVFTKVTHYVPHRPPQIDPGHVGIVTNSSTGNFIGAQSGGVAVASYVSGYWGSRGHKFYRLK